MAGGQDIILTGAEIANLRAHLYLTFAQADIVRQLYDAGERGVAAAQLSTSASLDSLRVQVHHLRSRLGQSSVITKGASYRLSAAGRSMVAAAIQPRAVPAPWGETEDGLLRTAWHGPDRIMDLASDFGVTIEFLRVQARRLSLPRRNHVVSPPADNGTAPRLENRDDEFVALLIAAGGFVWRELVGKRVIEHQFKAAA